jgi:hypothetical protein
MEAGHSAASTADLNLDKEYSGTQNYLYNADVLSMEAYHSAA